MKIRYLDKLCQYEKKMEPEKNVVVNNNFAYNVAIKIAKENEDPESKSIEECKNRKGWQKWKDAIQAELNSLSKREVFGPVVQTSKGVKPVGYKWYLCENKMKLMKL